MSRRDLAWLVLLGALWGAVYPLNTVVLRELPVAAVVVGRTSSAALVLVPVAWKLGALAAVRQRPWAVLTAAILQATIPLVLMTLGQQHVDAGVAGIVLASQPVWAVVITGVLDRHVERRVVVGVLVGLAGVALLFVDDLQWGETSGWGGLTLVGAAFCFAAGAVFIERAVPEVPALGTAAAAMGVSAVVLTPFAVGASPPLLGLATMWWLGVLGVGATGMALVLFYCLVRRVGAARGNMAGYLGVGFGLLFGLSLQGDLVHYETLVGLALIVLGIWLPKALPPSPNNSLQDQGQTSCT